MQDRCPQQILLWLWAVAMNAHANVGGIARRFGLTTLSNIQLPSVQESTPISQHNTLSLYGMIWANPDIWKDVLRGLPLIPLGPLTRPLGLLKGLLTCLLKLLKEMRLNSLNRNMFRPFRSHRVARLTFWSRV